MHEIKRNIYRSLIRWKKARERKPLILMGARQVGKTHLVRQVGRAFSNFIEINFERDPKYKKFFENGLDPHQLIRDLGLSLGEKIVIGKTLLFFDEISECEDAIKSLRYFYEELPELHLIAAGSLLDFSLERIGVPVGRVEFLNLYPLSFCEFLGAKGRESFVPLIEAIQEKPVSDPVHNELIPLFREYLAVGGMPEAVARWSEEGDFDQCKKIHRQIVSSYRMDFQKYARKAQVKHCDVVLNAVGVMLGRKWIFSQVDSHYRVRELKPALELLEKARVVHRVYHSSGNGVPLESEAHFDRYKVIFLDIALVQAMIGIETEKWITLEEDFLLNKGHLVEAVIGQELVAYSDPTSKAMLFYWHREKRGSIAEVDYLHAKNAQIIPIEVKSGRSFRLKSLEAFMDSKKSKKGIHASPLPSKKTGKITRIPIYAMASLSPNKESQSL